MMSGPDNREGPADARERSPDEAVGASLPLVIACTGHALAGGALVVLTGDVRICAAGAFRIGLNEVSIGLPVPVLAMELARDRLSKRALSNATLLAQIYNPVEAHAAGYLDEVVAAGEYIARAKAEAAPGCVVADRVRRDEEAPPQQDDRLRQRDARPRHGRSDDPDRRTQGVTAGEDRVRARDTCMVYRDEARAPARHLHVHVRVTCTCTITIFSGRSRCRVRRAVDLVWSSGRQNFELLEVELAVPHGSTATDRRAEVPRRSVTARTRRRRLPIRAPRSACAWA